VRIPEAGELRLEVYDVMGKRVWTQSEEVIAGMNEVNLNMADHRSGTYLYRLNLNGETISGKLIKQ
jgi:Fe-S cluster biosynthesis and repair protein YggX